VTISWTLLSELPAGAASHPAAWLGPEERRRLRSFRVEKRRGDWLRGRLAAKCLVARVLGETGSAEPAPDALEIVAESSGAPVVRLAGGRALPVGVSISHSEGTAFCAAWEGEGLRVGVDIERIAPRSPGFVRDFFRSEEAAAWDALPAGARAPFATAVWSAKESVLKALHLGLTVDTRSVGIALSGDEAEKTEGLPRPEGVGWKRFAARRDPALPGSGRPLAGYWRESGGYVLTVAVTRAA
jgi:4'-phosphopantetheinyl transferase